MLEVKNLEYGYNGKRILKDINLKAKSGTIVSIIGPNGSGKTTLLKCISGINRLWAGSISMDGREIIPPIEKKMSNIASFMPQEIPFSGALTVFETVLLGRSPHMLLRAGRADIIAVGSIMREIGIIEFAERDLGELSGGEKQRVFIAQALVREPRLLFLDEPTSSLDLRYQFEVLDIIKRITKGMGIATIIIIHDLNLAIRYSDKIVVLSEGKVVCKGLPGNVLTSEIIENVYGINAKVNIDNCGVPWINFSGLAAASSK